MCSSLVYLVCLLNVLSNLFVSFSVVAYGTILVSESTQVSNFFTGTTNRNTPYGLKLITNKIFDSLMQEGLIKLNGIESFTMILQITVQHTKL